MSADDPAFAALREEIAQHPSNAWASALGWRPLVFGSAASRVLIVSQAPGRLAQASGIAFDDPSGRLLRTWLGTSEAEFYDTRNLAIMPMDFYFPGPSPSGSGDLPPRRGVAELWHPRVRELMPEVRLTILIGAHAQRHYLGPGGSLTERVRAAGDHLPLFPIVHPSPLARGWRSRNPWFQEETVPRLRGLVAAALERGT
ncbi:uracil-DNA glycosylase family protein [Homoserinibacter sp. YIM 151385]|uniref:uracil-DNA glycosylase family protein n=1 Tax=Homoserinibacter sp. YIM 151385 TaxID=2985506 RepID=UPI0022F0D890|nr:uracil-DNA glycosylase family protein [Homoserinibacter sp. YIM 151385]WBU37457.1 uracil-DNA glycosylase family protein [Homoserinibacter sp. YIM 151385]